MADRTTLLSWVEALEPLAGEELEQLGARCQDIQLESGEEYGCNGDHEDGLLVVERGRVRVYELTPAGKQFTVALLGGGAIFPAWRSVDLRIEAMEASTITFLRDEVLEHLIQKSPKVGLQLVGTLSECLRRSNDRMFDMIHKDVFARLASFILELVEDEGVVTQNGIKIPTHYTHEQLGSMIGANRVAVTKAFAHLQDLGLVELKRRLIHVPDADALRSLAGRECIGE
jgi:CRP/FNR family transcriptional regulator